MMNELTELECLLSFPDLTLLNSFKNGSQGENDFYKFMRLVRNLKQNSDEQETYIKLLQQDIKLLQQDVIEMRDSTDWDRG
ncbi:hypothetical protein [Ectobacillus antri]|uniref:hypothetical protein n=1 Tax=Ectobacillus antri TaxID=2486280 RepID=UPI000F59AA29|nr:hypothetical protein [Ectobacillus antri]